MLIYPVTNTCRCIPHKCSIYIFLRQSPGCIEKLCTYPSYSIVLIIKPSVGLTLFTSSFIIFFTIVVFPALSKPLHAISLQAPTTQQTSESTYNMRIRISLSFNRAFRNIESILYSRGFEMLLWSRLKGRKVFSGRALSDGSAKPSAFGNIQSCLQETPFANYAGTSC